MVDDEARCTLCNHVVPENHFEVDAFGNAQVENDEDMFVMFRCRRCVNTTVVSDGGSA
jgi:hypothetical protein